MTDERLTNARPIVSVSGGGSQFEMFAAEEPTCVRWGMCEHKG